MKSGIASNRKQNSRANGTQDQLPRDLDAERWVLGSIALESTVLPAVLAILKPGDFFDETHRKIFVGMLMLVEGGKKIDPTLLVNQLRSSGDYDAVGGSGYLSRTISGVPHHGNAIFYAEIVRDHSLRRQQIEFATNVLRSANNLAIEPAETCGLINQFREVQSVGNDEIGYRVVKGTELATASHEVEYIVEGIYVAKQPMIIGGGKKNLKTNSLLDLGISITTGSPFLGKFAVNRCARVLIMTGESGEAIVAETCQRIARSKEVDLNDNLIISHDLPRVEEAAHQRALKRLLREERPEVVVLDPAYLVMSGDDAASLFKTGGVLRAVTELCKSEGASLILAHHTKKKSNGNRGYSETFSPPELEDLSWAGFQEFARQWLLYSRREPYDPENAGHHELWLSAGGSAGHSSLWSVSIDEGLRSDPGGRRWDVDVNPPSVARQHSQRNVEERREAKRNSQHQTRVDAAEKGIEKALISLPNNEGSLSQIASRAGKRGVAFDEAWGNLVRAGKLQECELAKSNGHKYAGFRWIFDRKA